MSMARIGERLAAGKLVFLDGAIGTELQRRGAEMHDEAWCALATETAPDILRGIHEDYIAAGADIVTVNTYSASRNMLGPAGLGDKVAPLHRQAVEIAMEARERAAAGRPVAVAGSMSHMVPMVRGGTFNDPAREPDAAELAANFQEEAELLKEAGCELILMEMMSHPGRAKLAVAAARATGLPVWVGFAVREADGALVSYVRESYPIAELVAEIVPAGGEVMGVMHTNVHLTGPALDAVRAQWDGPLMAYPDSGYFTMPDWQFEEIIPPDAFAGACLEWADAGVQILGGCCGLTVDHIRAMTAALGGRA